MQPMRKVHKNNRTQTTATNSDPNNVSWAGSWNKVPILERAHRQNIQFITNEQNQLKQLWNTWLNLFIFYENKNMQETQAISIIELCTLHHQQPEARQLNWIHIGFTSSVYCVLYQ